MALDLRLEARMVQGLVMTPRLQQAIKLLQYNHLEMAEHIQEAMLDNPTLETSSEAAGPDELDDRAYQVRDEVRKSEGDVIEQQNGVGTPIDWEKFLAQMEDRPRGASMSGGQNWEELPPIETNLTYGESLADHLLFQLHMARTGADERMAAEVIIHNLDHRGYLRSTLEEVCASAQVDAEVAQEARELVLGFDPIGCGSFDLGECLSVQARFHYPEDDNFAAILTRHLQNLERRNYGAISRDLGIEIEDVGEYHRMIKDLEPNPGRGFSTDEPRYISPDVYVVRQNGAWHVEVNEDGMPELQVSRTYQKLLKGASKQDREYLLDKLRGAEFLIKSVHKRRRTIRRVMDAIVKYQADFFERGPEALRPLVLQDVADEVGVHMSTVSRVTTNKYVHTSHGIFELKYFFSGGVRQVVGEDLASEAIKVRIKLLIQREDSLACLSDQDIADRLKREGIRLARRTVAKYREAMNILPSSLRKRSF